MLKAVLKDLYLWFREIQLQWKVDKLTDRLWDLLQVRRDFLPVETKAHSSNVRRELKLRLRISQLHYELNQVQRQLGVL